MSSSSASSSESSGTPSCGDVKPSAQDMHDSHLPARQPASLREGAKSTAQSEWNRNSVTAWVTCRAQALTLNGGCCGNKLDVVGISL